ncbi:MAG: carbohydrate binding family 9 domain-containing protein [Gemmatimonadota bacterium]|nr:carbohydrate binding family 9 domain-containing protein [Gemmatimonadota bacterium]
MLILAAIVALAGAPDSTLLKPADSVRIAIPRVSQRPVLDGKLDDATWTHAAKLTDFVEYEPNDLVRGREKSIAYVAYDAQYLFLGFRALESRPGQVRATVFPRERGGEGDDRVTFLLDTFLDKRRAVEFKANPFGIQTDGIKVEGLEGDPAPDFVWYSAGRTDDQGWSVEMMIPWASLRFPHADPLSIGFNVVRVYGRAGAKDSWVARRHGNPCEICQEGVLVGITGIDKHKTIDVLPYVSGSRLGTRRFAADSALSGGQFFATRPPLGFDLGDPRGAVGGDVKFTLMSSTILNATLNPDFSQVESDDDQVRVNQRFTLFQSERRTFFLESRDAFEIPRSLDESRSNIGDLFYSRAIVDPAAGVRLTGKQGRVTFGSLYVRDDQPGYFSYAGYESSEYRPLQSAAADVLVGRVRADILADSYVGVTALARRAGDSRNGVGAIDVSLRRGSITLKAEGGGSSDKAPFDPADATLLDGRTRKGVYYRALLAQSGKYLSAALLASGADSGFRDQVGRFSRVGIEQLGGRVTATQYPSSKIFQWLSQGINVSTARAFGGRLLDYTVTLPFQFQLQKATSFAIIPLRQHLTLFEKGLYMTGLVLEAASNASQVIAVSGNIYFGDREIVDQSLSRVGKGYNANVQLVVRPLPQASVDIKGQRTWHADKWGSPLVDDARILRVKAAYQFSRPLGLRLIEQYSNQYDARIANPFDRRGVVRARSALVSYELGPASFFYVGYNEGSQDFDEPIVENGRRLRTENQLFMKLSYLVRL